MTRTADRLARLEAQRRAAAARPNITGIVFLDDDAPLPAGAVLLPGGAVRLPDDFGQVHP